MDPPLFAGLGAATEAGIRDAFCTPHHLNGVFDNPRRSILTAVERLQARLTEAGIPLTLHPASELHLVPELPGRILSGEALTYNDLGRAALVELPKSTVPVGTETILEQLLYRGITPIVAHPERNATLARHPDRVGEWVDWGCKLQLTAQSCSGDFGHTLERVCRLWCERGWVHLIASDAHRPEGRSPDKLAVGRAVIAEWLGEAAAELMTETNPQRLLDGEEPIAPEPIRTEEKLRQRWWQRWIRLR